MDITHIWPMQLHGGIVKGRFPPLRMTFFLRFFLVSLIHMREGTKGAAPPYFRYIFTPEN